MEPTGCPFDVQQMFTFISEASENIISAFSPDRVFTYISPSVTDLLGYTPEEVVGKPAVDFNHPDDNLSLSRFQSVLRPMQDTDRFIGRVRHKNGEYRWFETTLRYIRDEAGNVIQIIGVGRDVTERQHFQNMLLQSAKLAIAGQLAAGIAHEVRNPLTTLKGFAQLLLSTATEEQRGYLEIMQTELNRIDLVVGELLLHAKPHILPLEMQNALAILEEVRSLMLPQAGMQNVEIIVQTGLDVYQIYGEANQLKQVFINIVKNALEAMPNGGHLVIQTRNEGGMLTIRFIDNGEGIPTDVLSKLGEPFFSTKDYGMGLGLMMSQRIIESHNGQLDISSQPGLGTTVCLSFPAMLTNGRIVTNESMLNE